MRLIIIDNPAPHLTPSNHPELYFLSFPHPSPSPIQPSTLNREWLSDVSWTMSMYLEAVAMLPQIFMFQRQASDQGGVVEVGDDCDMLCVLCVLGVLGVCVCAGCFWVWCAGCAVCYWVLCHVCYWVTG